ncbi:unnamed protein product [Pleuronectes platessa]|uniref:Uncharacterized protein n=1 Tax=Pleuronectes platessa TaxID=8262 RepID=A0A9N7Z8Q2_PLEPL|nr:unnamed protein product [Pleuronectes platessa]
MDCVSDTQTEEAASRQTVRQQGMSEAHKLKCSRRRCVAVVAAWLSRDGALVGGACLTGQARTGWTLATPPPKPPVNSGIKAPSRKLPEWDEGAMNAGLCLVHGHHIPLEPLCGVQQSVGQGRAGQGRRVEDRAGEWRTGQDRAGERRTGQERGGLEMKH